MNQFEILLKQKYHIPQETLIGGIDEAGRGAWAGPIVVAGVILPNNIHNQKIKDSKLLTAKQRNDMMKFIAQQALSISIIFQWPFKVDLNGSKKTTIEAMQTITNNWIKQFSTSLFIITDAEPIILPKTSTPYWHRAIIKGDVHSQTIAAASIVAKVTRDRYMSNITAFFPHYRWEHNKGYGTQEHQLLLQKHGPSIHHRMSYRPVKQWSCRKIINNNN